MASNVEGSPETIDAACQDLKAARREFLFEPPRVVREWLVGKLNDKRDIPLLFALFDITVCVVPSAVALFFLPSSHWLGTTAPCMIDVNLCCYMCHIGMIAWHRAGSPLILDPAETYRTSVGMCYRDVYGHLSEPDAPAKGFVSGELVVVVTTRGAGQAKKGTSRNRQAGRQYAASRQA